MRPRESRRSTVPRLVKTPVFITDPKSSTCDLPRLPASCNHNMADARKASVTSTASKSSSSAKSTSSKDSGKVRKPKKSRVAEDGKVSAKATGYRFFFKYLGLKLSHARAGLFG
ncbi:hypothetical protein MRX96_043009 [Rhipicephalus microplus]